MKTNGYTIPGNILKYEILKLIHGDNWSDVYLAKDNDRYYALKILKDLDFGADKKSEAFNEISRWKKLDHHENIVKLHEYEIFNNTIVLAMDYYPPDYRGFNTLQDYFNRNNFSFNQSIKWSIEICNGMEYAYSKKLCPHLDIKPSNIIIGADGIARISDFGINHLYNRNPAPSIRTRLKIKENSIGLSTGFIERSITGTPTHMSPEHFKDPGLCDHSSDIFSLGIILYQMINNGKCPFMADMPRDDSEEEVNRFFKQQKKIHYNREPVIPGNRIILVIDKCLKKDSSKRYTSFGELKEALFNSLGDDKFNFQNNMNFSSKNLNDLFFNGLTSIQLKNYTEALDSLQKAIHLDIKKSYTWFYHGLAYFFTGNYSEAMASMDRSIECDPLNSAALAYKGKLLTIEKKFDEAFKCMQESMRINNMDTLSYIFLGDLYREENKFDDALKILTRGLDMKPGDPGITCKIGELYLAMRQIDKAIVYIDKAMEIDPDNHVPVYLKGFALLELGFADKSIALLNQSISMDPHYPDAWYKKGQYHVNNREYREALECMGKAMNKYQENAGYWYSLGEIHGKLGNMESALESYDRAVAINPEFSQAYYNKGDIYIDDGKYDKAIECLTRYLSIEGDDIYGLNKLGDCNYFLARYDESISSYNSALNLNPAEPYTLLKLGATYQAKNDFFKAVEYCDRAIRSNPENQLAWVIKGNCLYEMDKGKESIECFKKAIEINPDDPEIWLYKGKIEEKLRKLPDALHSYKHFVKIALEENSSQLKYVNDKIRELEKINRLSTLAAFTCTLAEIEAKSLNHRYITAEHFLAGILNLPGYLKFEEKLGFSQAIINEIMIEKEAINTIINQFNLGADEIIRILRDKVKGSYSTHPESITHQSTEYRKILSEAVKLVHENKDITVLHLLNAILNFSGNMIIETFQEMKIDIVSLRKKVNDTLTNFIRQNEISESKQVNYLSIKYFKDINRLEYDLIKSNKGVFNFNILINPLIINELSERLDLHFLHINNKIWKNSECFDDIVKLREILTLLVPKDLVWELGNMEEEEIQIIPDDEISGIPWELIISKQEKRITPVLRKIRKYYTIAGRNEPSNGGILTVFGSGENIPFFEISCSNIINFLSSKKSIKMFKFIRAEDPELLLRQLFGSRYEVLIYFGHAEFGGSPETTGWRCMNNRIFSCDLLQTLAGSIPDVIISNACESARSSLLSETSLAHSAINAGSKTYIGTHWFLEFQRGNLFIESFLNELCIKNHGVKKGFYEAMKALKDRFGEKDISAFNYVYYGE